MVADVEALPLGYLLNGAYRIESVLGTGAFGVTYRAHHLALDRPFAIKEYFPREFAGRSGSLVVARANRDQALFDWGLDRFLDEGRILARFKHPNIVFVHQLYRANGTAYLVMDWEPGESLHQRLEKLGRLDPGQVLNIAERLIDGLEAVHAEGITHRDVKPANIYLRDDGSPVLLDFGAARQQMGDHTRTMTALATPGYGALEQYSSTGRQGPWTDVYGLAATLRHAITGIAPRDAPERALEDTERPLLDRAPMGYPMAFLAAIDQGLALKASDRPQTMVDWRALIAGVEPPGAVRARGRRRLAVSILVTAAALAATIVLTGVALEIAGDPAEPPLGPLAGPGIELPPAPVAAEAEPDTQTPPQPVAEEPPLSDPGPGQAPALAPEPDYSALCMAALRAEDYETAVRDCAIATASGDPMAARPLEEAIAGLTREAPERAEAERAEAERAEAERAEAQPAEPPPEPVVPELPAVADLPLPTPDSPPRPPPIAPPGATLDPVPQPAPEPEVAAVPTPPVPTPQPIVPQPIVPAPSPSGVLPTDVYRGRTTVRVQRALAALGLFDGPVDGRLSNDLLEGARAFQAGIGQPPTGILTREEMAQLDRAVATGQSFGRLPSPSPNPSPQGGPARPTATAARVPPGAVIRDCQGCPEMVALPPGSFVMGSAPREVGRDDDEGPARRLSLDNQVAMARNEVTRAQYRAFANATGRPMPSCGGQIQGLSDEVPVACVTWDDAAAYADWLTSRTTGTYRLPSEAEWEYAARAGSEAPRFWGSDPGLACRHANVFDYTARQGFGDAPAVHACHDGAVGMTRVGAYQPNAFGLNDMIGNAAEWVADCYAPSLEILPGDGSALSRASCYEHTVRGGDFLAQMADARVAARRPAVRDSRAAAVGFRVVREIE